MNCKKIMLFIAFTTSSFLFCMENKEQISNNTALIVDKIDKLAAVVGVRLNTIQNSLDELEFRYDNLETQVQQCKQQMDIIKKTQLSQDQKINTNLSNIQGIKSKFTKLKAAFEDDYKKNYETNYNISFHNLDKMADVYYKVYGPVPPGLDADFYYKWAAAAAWYEKKISKSL